MENRVEPLNIGEMFLSGSEGLVVSKLNELIESYNNHIHYARELQMPTSTPNNTEVYK